MSRSKIVVLIALVGSVLVSIGGVQANNVLRFKMPKNAFDEGMPKSCADLLATDPSKKSGFVTIFPKGFQGDAREVYCDMETDGGGWTRIMSLGVGQNSCYGSFSLNPSGFCAKNGRLVSVSIDTLGLSFSQMRGGVVAYQSGSNDGFRRYASSSHINDTYVDGISFTYKDGDGNRQHIYTYAIGQTSAGNPQSCPDVGGVNPPSFVGSDYFCDSGNSEEGYTFDFYKKKLFDGAIFQKTLPQNAQGIEVRVMNDQNNYDENIALDGIFVFIR